MNINEIETWADYRRITAGFVNRDAETKTGLAAIADCLRNHNMDKATEDNGSIAITYDEAEIYRPRTNHIAGSPECNITFAGEVPEKVKISESEGTAHAPVSEQGHMRQAEMTDAYASEAGSFYEELGEAGISEEFRAGTYGSDDMAFIIQYAAELKRQMEDACYVWSIGEPDSELGKALAEEKLYIQKLAAGAGISDKAEKLVNRVFQPYIDKFMDALDEEIENNRKKEYSWLFRTTDINRDAVYRSYQSALRNA